AERRVSARPGVRLRGTAARAGGRRRAPRPALDLGRPRGVRPEGRGAGADVPRQLRPVRGYGRRCGRDGRTGGVIPDAPWRVVIVSQVPRVAAGYAEFIRSIGHEPVAHLAARFPPTIARRPQAREFASRLLFEAPQ